MTGRVRPPSRDRGGSEAHVVTSLLVTRSDQLLAILALLGLAADASGWIVVARSAAGEALDPRSEQEAARAQRARLLLPPVRFVTVEPGHDGADAPLDARRLLERARREARRLDEDPRRRAALIPGVDSAVGLLRGVQLDAVRSLDRASES